MIATTILSCIVCVMISYIFAIKNDHRIEIKKAENSIEVYKEQIDKLEGEIKHRDVIDFFKENILQDFKKEVPNAKIVGEPINWWGEKSIKTQISYVNDKNEMYFYHKSTGIDALYNLFKSKK